MKKTRSRKTNRAGLVVLIASLVVLAVVVLGAMIYGIYLVRRDQFGAPGDKAGAPGEKSFAPDAGAVGKLQESEYAFARSRLKMKLPRGFKENANRSSELLEEVEFRDGSLR